MAYDLSHGVHTPLTLALRQLDGWMDAEERTETTLLPNKLADEFADRLRRKPMNLPQRRYLAQIASRTAREDALSGDGYRLWHLLRDAHAKRLPMLAFRPNDPDVLFDIIVFGRIAIANARLMAGVKPGRAPENLPDHFRPSGFTGLAEFFDVMEERFFPHLETLHAAVAGQGAEETRQAVKTRMAEIAAHVHEGLKEDMTGLDILGPIDPVRFHALRHKTKLVPAPSPVA